MSDVTGTTFRRPPSRFRDWISADGATAFPAEPCRYHLYVSWACPWAHRTVIGRRLTGLEHVIGMSVVDPIRNERGWAFPGGEYKDPVNGFGSLAEGYERRAPAYDGRISVRVVWEAETGGIVNNESADGVRMFPTELGHLATRPVVLCPGLHRE